MKQLFIFLFIIISFNNFGQQYQRTVIQANVNGAYGLLERDLNNDGFMDLMGTAQTDNQVYILINDGTGQFTQTIIDNNFTGALFMDAADFDNDGDMDYAATGSTELVWYQNNNGTFVKSTIDTGLNNPRQVALSDMGSLFNPGTPDGDIDIGILKGGDNSVSIYINNGNNNFSDYNLISINEPRDFYLGDFDGDGSPDILVSSYTDNKIVWYKQGSFGLTQGGTVTNNFSGAWGVRSADIDNDGDYDVIGTAYGANEIAWFENTDGTGTNFIKHTVDNNIPGPSFLKYLDIDHDGNKDIITTGYGDLTNGTLSNPQVAIYYNDGANNFTKNIIDSDIFGASTFAVADFTGNGEYDIAVSGHASNEIILLTKTTNNINYENLINIKIYPNPAKDIINIQAEKSINTIEVFDMSGRKIIDTPKQQINIKKLQSGCYLVKINLKNGQNISKKVIIE
jgi:hypothetical protein